MNAFWLVPTYDLLEDRRIDDVIIKTFFNSLLLLIFFLNFLYFIVFFRFTFFLCRVGVVNMLYTLVKHAKISQSESLLEWFK